MRKYAKDEARGMHEVIEGPHYERTDEETTANDRRQGSDRAYEKASKDRRKGLERQRGESRETTRPEGELGEDWSRGR